MTPASFRRRVFGRIRVARLRLRLTQEDAAQRVGLTARYYADVERGRRNPSLDVLFSISRALRVSVADLVDVEGKARIDLDHVIVEPLPRGRQLRGPRR